METVIRPEADAGKGGRGTRRALLTGAAIGAAGLVASQAGAAQAVNGSPLILGTSNNATANTKLTATTSAIGLTVENTGSGAAMFFNSANSNGVAGRTGNAAAYGFSAANVAAAAGSGAALAASGIQNDGIQCNTVRSGRSALVAQHLSGTGGYVEAGGVSDFLGSPLPQCALLAIGGNDPAGFGGIIGGIGGAGLLMVGDSGTIGGNFSVDGTLTKTAGAFKIQHPTDPDKWLYHSFVESPEMINVYSGIADLDTNGTAVVALPGYFEALNAAPTYQLTAVGAPMPDLHVAQEVSGNSFTIAGGAPGKKVSWQVSGVRQDAYALEHPIVPEVDKVADTSADVEPFEEKVREALKSGTLMPARA